MARRKFRQLDPVQVFAFPKQNDKLTKKVGMRLLLTFRIRGGIAIFISNLKINMINFEREHVIYQNYGVLGFWGFGVLGFCFFLGFMFIGSSHMFD